MTIGFVPQEQAHVAFITIIESGLCSTSLRSAAVLQTHATEDGVESNRPNL